MIKLKKLHLQNFCGYRDSEFDFTTNEELNSANVFFGSNGVGKTKILEAIRIITNPQRYENKDCSILFNKFIFNKNYEPSTSIYKEKLAQMLEKVKNSDDKNNPLYKDLKISNISNKTQMYVEGTFETDEGEKIVAFDNNGIAKNELPYKEIGHSFFIDADHPNEMNKFQLENNDLVKVFLELAHIVYGYPVKLGKIYSNQSAQYYTDFIIEKWGTTVHFKSFSDGEKKICSLIRSICDVNYIPNTDIILIDNVEMHIYYLRHIKLFNALTSIFSNYQFFLTSHSGTLIEYLKENKPNYLYDLEKYKQLEFEKFNVKENLGWG